MKKNIIVFASMLVMILSSNSFPQMGGGGCHLNPDSLEVVTVSGTAIVDTVTMMHPIYYIDTNNNGEADYFLNFGPWWYEPDSSNATRPNNGDQIEIEGGLWDGNMMGHPMIVVYEINGEFWRDPLDAFWNNMGNHNHGGGHFNNGCNGYGWGWMHDSITTVTVSGTALVDTTFYFEQYYLDEDGNGVPEYFLNFGPPWYEPQSGATRPNNGDQITIVGGKIDRPELDRIIVFEINGLLWRDSTNIYPHFGGGWCHRNMTQPVQIKTPYDTNDMMQINPGWGGMMMPQQIFCQILELDPINIPFSSNQNILAGYEIGVYNQMGMNMLWEGGGCGGMLNFNSNINYNLRYTDYELGFRGIDESSLVIKYWNQQNNNWSTFQNPVINTQTNTVTLSSDVASNFIIITGNQIVSGNQNSGDDVPNNYVLEQNYPNPFNPSTTINYSITEDGFVKLAVYNMLGEEVATLVNSTQRAGNYNVTFDASSLSSGVYVYRIEATNFTTSKKMVLMK